MKLIELEINNIRGIKKLTLTPNGENLLVWGPNGSGKSGVVDAIDFLLTGNISRLTGEGTGDISLSQHGKHIDTEDPTNSRVRAIIELPSNGEHVELVRSMDRAGNLKYPKANKEEVENIIGLAKRGQHVLTRREILKYITAESRTRANEIQSLLNISQIENIRKALKSANNSIGKELDQSKHELTSCTDRICEVIGEDIFSEKKLLKKINNYRNILSAKPIKSINPAELKKEVTHIKTASDGQTVNIGSFKIDIDNIKSLQNGTIQQSIRDQKNDLIAALDELKSSPEMVETLKRKKLIDLGIELLDDTGSCPLCDTGWDDGKLKKYLANKQKNVKTAEKIETIIKDSSLKIKRFIDKAKSSIDRVISVIEENKALKKPKNTLVAWKEIINNLSLLLNDNSDLYKERDYILEKVELLIDEYELSKLLDQIYNHVNENIPKSSPENEAWDNLTRLEERLQNYEELQLEIERKELNQKRSSLLQKTFLESRDLILYDLYRTIEDRFVELYCHIHGPDEDGFSAELKPEEAGLYIGVEFYGRGKHPPHALHSEGHQDSMGICLYLALTEKLNKDLIQIIILDDVLMSVDFEHRRNVCSLLRNYFPNKQLIITTHDKTWANQIKHDGIVTSSQSKEFYDWSIDKGPRMKVLLGLWERIENHLINQDVENAAFELRNGSEEYFADVCASLQSQIRYDLNGKNTSGEYIQGAISQYSKLLKKAKSAAHSWDKKELYETLDELDSRRKQISERLNVENWAVNETVHFNKWQNFSVKDFRPVVEAFIDLFGIFKCQTCGGIIKLVFDNNHKEQGVQCDCGQTSWNLAMKKDVKVKN